MQVGLSAGLRRIRSGISPALQLSALWGKTGTTGPEADEGAFGWALGRAEACPLQLRLSAGFAFEPCLTVEAGQLTARGDDDQVAEPETARRLWLAAGSTLSLHWQQDHVFLRGAGLVLVPATRDEFVFSDPDRSVHQAGPVLAGVTIGVGFQW